MNVVSDDVIEAIDRDVADHALARRYSDLILAALRLTNADDRIVVMVTESTVEATVFTIQIPRTTDR